MPGLLPPLIVWSYDPHEGKRGRHLVKVMLHNRVLYDCAILTPVAMHHTINLTRPSLSSKGEKNILEEDREGLLSWHG